MRKKLQRFADNAKRRNVIELSKASHTHLQGRWRADYFNNKNDLVVELGCGKGAYTLGLAQQFPYKNFVGVDIKGARLWVGSSYALAHGLCQVAFLRTKIEQLDQCFAPGEISELHIPFPDPRPRDRDEKHRLTSPRFLALYRQLIQPGGYVHLKTDDTGLFAYTLEVLRVQPISSLVYTEDLYQSEWLAAHYGIQTDYERKFLAQGAAIKYLRFSFDTVEPTG
ncbi:MAG: tRNA (guanosine(46)-N7)-methyltransferase TrmB [Amoebophilaceae bacterium]|jgi:tRNA (guanine-N7-)-methyltransferase|nr:tRNA (guanosine(46)-N7)-methyltransferase TrmB [Amoebophilaceae bacterium]